MHIYILSTIQAITTGPKLNFQETINRYPHHFYRQVLVY